MNKYKVYLLGAGASYGYDENLPKNRWPPLTDDLFVAGTHRGILTAERYPNLVQELINYLNAQGRHASIAIPSSLKVDVETFLSWLDREFRRFAANAKVQRTDSDTSSRQWVVTNALGECRYFIYELLSLYSLEYQRDGNCYQKLALSIKGNGSRCAIVTLNYDTLPETAFESEEVSFHYLPNASKEAHSLPLAKLHGSINWGNPRGGAIAFGNVAEEELFCKIVMYIHSNAGIVGGGQISLVKAGTRENLIHSGTDYYEPVVIPPFSLYKVEDYARFPILRDVWIFGENLIRSASELVIVGCKLREEDEQLCQMLQSAMTDSMRVTLVSPSHAEIEQRLKKLEIKTPIVSRYCRFVEYVHTL